MRYRIKHNNGLLQYPYSVIDKQTGYTVDSCITLIGCLVIIWKHRKV